VTAELMARAQAGDVDAFGQLYAAHYNQVRLYAESRHPGHGDDIAQDVFVRALGALHQWKDHGRGPGPWFGTIAANMCVDRARRTKAVHYRQIIPVAEILDLYAEAPEPGPERQAIAQAVRAELKAALAGVTPEQRTALVEYYLHEKSIAETARVLGRGEGAVRSILMRARAAMARQLTAVADA
jgi:RNA polymerase sigma-70 factor (ECF subfamily)